MPVRIPTYQQQTTRAVVPQPRSNPVSVKDNTGAQITGIGGDLVQMGDQLEKAQARVQAKQETITRARAFGSFMQDAETQLRTMSTTEDFSSPQAVAEYNQFLRERRAKALEEYQGSEEGRLMLVERLETGRFELLGKASAASAEQQKKLLEGAMGARLNALSARVRQNPTELVSAFEDLDKDIDEFAPAMTPDEERSRRMAGREALVEGSIDWFVERGMARDAERLLLETPGVLSSLSPTKQRELFNRIGTARAAALKDAKTVKGIPIDVFNRLNWDEQRRVMGALPAEANVFGESLAGRSLEIMADQTSAFAGRQMSEQQERQYIAAVQNYIQPHQFMDPATGQVMTRRNEVPSYVADAFRARGINLATPGGVGVGGGVPGLPTPERAEVERELFAGVTPQLFEGGKTISEMGHLFTGPLPAVLEVIGATPGIGVGASEINEARTNIKISFKRLVSALQQNPRFNEGERKAIAADLEVEPKIWDNPSSFVERMVGIDRALEGYQRDAERALGSTISMERRRKEMDTLQTIIAFRSKLMPKRMENDQQVVGFIQSAQPGTPFIAKDENGKWTVYRTK